MDRGSIILFCIRPRIVPAPQSLPPGTMRYRRFRPGIAERCSQQLRAVMRRAHSATTFPPPRTAHASPPLWLSWSFGHSRAFMPNEDLRNTSFIRNELWDAAGWQGCGFLVAPDQQIQPGIALRFRDYVSGCRIFTDWRERFGESDTYDMLRVTLISGTHPRGTHGYTLSISTDPAGVERHDIGEAHLDIASHRFAQARSFFHETNGTNSFLSQFRESLHRVGTYFMVPLSMSGERDMRQSLQKSRAFFRDYSEITSAEDIDAAALNA